MQAKHHHILSTPTYLGLCKHLSKPLRPSVRYRPTNRHTSISTSSNRVSTLEVDDDDGDDVEAFWDYQFLFMSQRLEVPNPIKLKLIDGAIPKDFPSGTYYLIGPGLFTDDYGSSINPLDGHGYLRAFEIDGPNGEVRYSAQYVKTEAQMEECDPQTRSWKFAYRGPFSVIKSGQRLGNVKVMKNVANTSILKWGGRMFCLWEGGLPYEIDPNTLDTIGSFDFVDGEDSRDDENECDSSSGHCCVWNLVARLLKPILYGVFKMPPKRMLSHYKIDARRGRLIVMTCNAEDMVLPISHCTFYEFDLAFKLLHKRAFCIPIHSLIHDWGFTDTHYILFTNQIKVDIVGSMKAICGTRPMISTLSMDHSKPTTPIYILPRFLESENCSNDCVRQPIEAPQSWLLHVANAYEEIDNDGNLLIKLHATTCSYKWFNFQNMFGYYWHSDILDPSGMNYVEGNELWPHLVEVFIKINKDGHQICSITNLNKCRKSSDFPIINPQYSGYKHTYVYAATCSGSRRTLPHFPFDTIVRFDTLNNLSYAWYPGDRRFVGEPIFISKGTFGEDNGYLLVIEYVVSHRVCNLLILDAQQVGQEGALIARFEVPKLFTFPLGFHGTWIKKE